MSLGGQSRGGFGGGGGGTKNNPNLNSDGGFGGGGGGLAIAAFQQGAGGFGGGGAGGPPFGAGQSGRGGFGGGSGGASGSSGSGGFGGGSGGGILGSGSSGAGVPGFGGGRGATVPFGSSAPGGGGAGFGGAVFVREGGTLSMRYTNAGFRRAATGNFAQAGSPGGPGAGFGRGAGEDVFVDQNTIADLRVGAGEVEFTGDIAGRGGLALSSPARGRLRLGATFLSGPISVRNAQLVFIDMLPLDLASNAVTLGVAAVGAQPEAPLVKTTGQLRLGNLTLAFAGLALGATYRVAQSASPDFGAPTLAATEPAGVTGVFVPAPGPNQTFVLNFVVTGVPDAVFADGFEP